jgi:ABC-2 type transport system ATP-binding protein
MVAVERASDTIWFARLVSIKRKVGYMTQRFSLWERPHRAQNLDFVGRLYGVRHRRAAVTETLNAYGLADRADQLAGTLSGGWKQRLALAACLLHRPQLLLLDEPTAGVDPTARREFWEELHRLSSDGVTVLVSTHYMDEAERCHRLRVSRLWTPDRPWERGGHRSHRRRDHLDHSRCDGR